MTSLAVLNVMDCSVSDEAVVALRKALPRLAVSHTRAPEGYWELILTDTEVLAVLQHVCVIARLVWCTAFSARLHESAVLSWLQDEFDDLNGEEWEVSLELQRNCCCRAGAVPLLQAVAQMLSP